MEIDVCNAIASSNCGAKFKELGACRRAHPACDANGKTTLDAPECKQLNDDVAACLQAGQ
jgi:hypothetical protein